MSHRNTQTLDPNNFVDVDDVFPKYHDEDEISYAEFVIIPGTDTNGASLIYRKRGVEGTSQEWGLSMRYGYIYNGPSIPISKRDADRILDNLYSQPLDEVDWETDEHSYFE